MFKYLFLFLTLQFANLDREFTVKADYAANRDALLAILPEATPGPEKAEVLWRLSRAWLMLGDGAATKEEKRNCYAEGIKYADACIAEDPANPEGYLWHCGNIGRDCQTRKLMEQAAVVPKMSADLTTVLDKLGRTDNSQAWQALSAIYWAHPFKSSDAAINFARKAALTIPKDELRIGTLTNLAEMLYKRNWSAKKRAYEAEANRSRFAAKGKSNIDRYAFFDGASEEKLSAPWNPAGYTTLTDREEALAITAYAQRIYRDCKAPSPVDKSDIKTLNNILKQWQ